MDTDKLDLMSPDMVNENFEKLATLFPNCVTEGADGKAIDFDLLKQELNHAVVEGNKERYRLEWPGKKEAIVTANLPTTKTLRPIRKDSVDFDNTENLYIEGDNLEVLKILQESYLGKIKMIYIDPPYNTGNDFVYKDNFTQDKEKYKEESGLKDEYNQRLLANPETAGRYHSDWLSMMYPRLKLARNLLTDDGLIFISIDEGESSNLRKLLNEIFGEINYVGSIAWKKTSGDNKPSFAFTHDTIHIFGKNQKVFPRVPLTKEQRKQYKNPDNDPRGDWAESDYRSKWSKEQRPNLYYSISQPNLNIEIYPDSFSDSLRIWGSEKSTFIKDEKENLIWWGLDGKAKEPKKKRFLANHKGANTRSLWLDAGSNDQGSKELRDLLDGDYFDNPKPTSLLKRIFAIAVKGEDICLDFFSGSASASDALLQLNSEDSGSRKFIQVQLPENTNEKSEAFKAGYKNICEIGKERIRRAGKKIFEELESKIESKKAELDFDGDSSKTNYKLDIGFRVYRLDDSNMQDVYYKPQDYKQDNLELFEDNVKSDRTADDLLAQVMLDWGLPLSLKIEQSTINGKKVFKVAENSLFACFDNGIDESFAKEIAKEKPLRIVFRDNGFKDDTAKVNVKQLLKQLSPETEMKVI